MLVTNFKFKYFTYRIVCALYQFLDIGRMHPLRERSIRALNQTVNFIDENMSNAIGFETQKEITEYALQIIKIPGAFMEFGVYEGGTIRFIAKNIKNNRIYGFDSFRGLPDEWSGFNMGSGAFNVDGKLPRVPNNVKLYAGWFDNTIPIWLEECPELISFIHIDCDIYSSTKTIFDLLEKRIQNGTIILFDEFFNYPGWQLHEYKAFEEFIQKSGYLFEYLAYARQQVVVRIVQISDSP